MNWFANANVVLYIVYCTAYLKNTVAPIISKLKKIKKPTPPKPPSNGTKPEGNVFDKFDPEIFKNLNKTEIDELLKKFVKINETEPVETPETPEQEETPSEGGEGVKEEL